MAGEQYWGSLIQAAMFPDMPTDLGRDYAEALYGPKIQITTMLSLISSQHGLITGGGEGNPRREAILDTIWQMYATTRVYRHIGDDVIRTYDKEFWEIEFSDLMDDLDFLDKPLNSRFQAAGDPFRLEEFSGEFAKNIARMILIGNDPQLLPAHLRNFDLGRRQDLSQALQQGFAGEISACIALYTLLERMIAVPEYED